MKKKVGEFFVDDYPSLTVIRSTPARGDFSAAHNDVITLLRIHDHTTGDRHMRLLKLHVLKRSALILLVTAWESFVEDTVTQQLENNLKIANTPADVSTVFNSVAHEWLDPQQNSKRHSPDLAMWAGENWKKIIMKSLSETLVTFHTPNAENTDKLFKKYLGVNIKKHWTWQGVTSTKAQQHLDNLIKLRGQVVHHGKTEYPFSVRKLPTIERGVVVRAVNLIYNLVDATERTLGVSPIHK